MAKVSVRFRLDFAGAGSIGPGKIDLLESIRATGSLSQAGRQLGMSYRRAWLLLDGLNNLFHQPVVTTSIGGKAGGGAVLTEFGITLLAAYRQLEKDMQVAAEDRFANVRFAGVIEQLKVSKKKTGVRTTLARASTPPVVKPKARDRAVTRP